MATKVNTAAAGKAAAQAKTAPSKPAAPKSAAPLPSEAAHESAPAPKPQPAVKPSAPAASSVPSEPPGANNGAPKKTRQQLTVIIDTDISPARCQTHFRMNLGDAEIEAQITELRKELKTAAAGKKAEQVKALKTRIAELQQSLVRISSETPIATAAILDYMVKELLRHGMDQAKAAEDKLVEVNHLHTGNPAALLCFPLVNKLPEWTEFDPELEDEMKKERAAENKAAKDAREAKKANEEKKGGGPTAARAKAAKVAKAEDGEEGDEDEQEHTKTTFYTYVDNALKTVKKEEEYRSTRVSNRVREYLSEITASAIARIAFLSRIIVQQVMSVRTMNANHVMAVVVLLMADEGRSDEQVRELKALVDEKLKIYRDHNLAEKKKKDETLAADKKADLARKAHQLDLARKKKQIEAAKKRAEDAEKKMKELAKETAALEPIVAAEKAAAEKAAAEKPGPEEVKP
jgi:hypothetical protein